MGPDTVVIDWWHPGKPVSARRIKAKVTFVNNPAAAGRKHAPSWVVEEVFIRGTGRTLRARSLRAEPQILVQFVVGHLLFCGPRPAFADKPMLGDRLTANLCF
jgi:hypothetical protein